MQIVAYKIIPDVSKNSISFSKNYRIFSTGEPLEQAIQITGFVDDIDLGSANSAYIIRKLRYSTDKANWSLWYSFTEDNLTNLTDLAFSESNIFFEVKYEYDDSTYSAITTPLSVNEIKIRVKSSKIQADLFTPTTYCSSEQCPALIAEREASFKPYELNTAIGIAHELSFQTNKLFGHEVIYFKTEPDREGTDFIFKEYTLFKTTDRQCIKILVPENKFPDNKPNFTEFGVDFSMEIPFEIHIDNTYFQMIFGKKSQPRKRDYIFIPLVNRMYEIQGSYLYRGFGLEPIYWKIQLVKFNPNIDMFMKAADRTFLDNIIVSTEQLFGAEAEVQKKDALNKQQFSTISTKFDESRQRLHPDIKNKILDITFNYSPLIEYYYDLSGVLPAIVNYTLTESASSSAQIMTTTSPYEVYAYESSNIFSNWLDNSLVTGDAAVISATQNAVIRMNGPKDSFTASGKYVVVEGYKNLGLKSTERRDLVATANVIQLKQAEHAVVYKKPASTTDTPNMTFSAIVNFNRVAQNVIFFRGYDDYTQKGVVISGTIVDNSGVPNLTIYVKINETQYSFPVGNIEYLKWYPLIVPISSEFNQLEVNMYSLRQDPANIKNFNKILPVYSHYVKTQAFTFNTTSSWSIPSANYSIANIRLFNTMIQTEDHEFIVSQLFIRDESVLSIIDNARPKLNIPFIGINR